VQWAPFARQGEFSVIELYDTTGCRVTRSRAPQLLFRNAQPYEVYGVRRSAAKDAIYTCMQPLDRQVNCWTGRWWKPVLIAPRACRPWLEAEIAVTHPQVIVCLVATAAQSILGPDYRLTKERGKFVQHLWARHVTATVHPSSILRAPDQEQRRIQYREFVADLKQVREVLKHAPGSKRRLP
jgi:uracil-DNA glycosylase family 4